MSFSDYLIDYLIRIGVTDVFGIPGGVVLDFIYSVEKRKGEISLHLCAHEQAAGFAAIGYAQMTGKVCVAYATRGPGFTNLITAIGDAFFDSLPVLFITAHARPYSITKKRLIEEQEFDTISCVNPLTKIALRLDSILDIKDKLIPSITELYSDCPGPVVLDVLSSLFSKEINFNLTTSLCENKDPSNKDISLIKKQLQDAKCPVILAGAGIRQSGMVKSFCSFVDTVRIPVVSSFLGMDTISSSDYYFGYIGSHGERSANYILHEADLIISIGNRLNYNKESATFSYFNSKKIIRIEVDENEMDLESQNEIFINHNLKDILPLFNKFLEFVPSHINWLMYCNQVKKVFDLYDVSYPINVIAKIFINTNYSIPFVSDVGNNEFFITKAYSYSKAKNRLLLSKSFSALGCSLPKALGIYYSIRSPVVAMMGDQAFLMNVQELHTISVSRLPICIIVLNNFVSGMIKTQEERQKRDCLLHTSLDSGYVSPDIKSISSGFNIQYFELTENEDSFTCLNSITGPMILELKITTECSIPSVPKGNRCYDMIPTIPETVFKRIDELKRLFYEKT